MRESLGHIQVHGLQGVGHQVRHHFINARLHANSEMRRVDLLPFGKFIHKPKTK